MKIKFLEFEYDFNKDDAKIVVPLILLFIALLSTNIAGEILIALAVTYYALYFYLEKITGFFKSRLIKLKCPNCKSRKIFLQGYQSYKSDEYYPYYLCNECNTTSVMIQSGLMIA